MRSLTVFQKFLRVSCMSDGDTSKIIKYSQEWEINSQEKKEACCSGTSQYCVKKPTCSTTMSRKSIFSRDFRKFPQELQEYTNNLRKWEIPEIFFESRKYLVRVTSEFNRRVSEFYKTSCTVINLGYHSCTTNQLIWNWFIFFLWLAQQDGITKQFAIQCNCRWGVIISRHWVSY